MHVLKKGKSGGKYLIFHLTLQIFNIRLIFVCLNVSPLLVKIF